jgi:hypothetical protein
MKSGLAKAYEVQVWRDGRRVRWETARVRVTGLGESKLFYQLVTSLFSNKVKINTYLMLKISKIREKHSFLGQY